MKRAISRMVTMLGMLSWGRPRVRLRRRRLRSIGPELISGASGNDPTNVGTAAAVGARTTYQLSWVSVLVGPMLYVMLAIAAQVAVTAGSDLQSLALKRYGRRVAAVLLTLVVVVNVVTIAADLQAGAAGIGLLTGLASGGLCSLSAQRWRSCC